MPNKKKPQAQKVWAVIPVRLMADGSEKELACSWRTDGKGVDLSVKRYSQYMKEGRVSGFVLVRAFRFHSATAVYGGGGFNPEEEKI